jgi:hypothetical protein
MVGAKPVKLTRDVVKDLLPVYIAGEASADTKVLVEEFLRGDPELAALVHDERAIEFLKQPVALPQDHEKKSLRQLKRLIKIQTWLLAGALLFSLVPLSIRLEQGSITFLVLHDTPILAAVYWLIAAAFWLGYFLVRRRVRVSGI